MKKIVRLCTMLFVFSLFFAVPISAEAKSPNKSVCTDSGWEALKSVNEMRLKRGLTPLSMSERMYSGAKIRAKELNKKFSHIRPNGNSYRSVYANKKYIKNSKEGIAKNIVDEVGCIRVLKRNAEDKRNMLSKSALHFSTACRGSNGVAMYSGCDCTHTIRVKGAGKTIKVEKGTSIEDLDLALVTSCKHGKGYVPITSKMVSGYNKNKYGKQTLTIKWNGLQTTVRVNVVRLNIAKAKVVDAPSFVGFYGKPVNIEGHYKVVYKGKVLKKGVDYTVSYKNNDREGFVKLVISGKGKYTGKLIYAFETYEIKIIYDPRYY